MENHFVTTYFYYTNENPLRKKFKDEFMTKYPWIHLLEANGIPGFIDYRLINQWLKTIDKTNLKSITVLDSDLILQDNFRELVDEALDSGFDVIHGADQTQEMLDGQLVERSTAPAMTKFKTGFTGFIWSFSKRFLELIDYRFPDQFLLGGLDFFFALLFIKQYPESIFKKYLEPESVYNKMYFDFFDQTTCLNAVRTTTLCHKVIHNFHGSRENRLTDFSKYREIIRDPSLIPDLMAQRDQYFS